MGDRMKGDYERRTQIELPRRTHTLIRIDGKAFHTYTRGLERPYDKTLMDDMAETTRFLCQEIQGARVGYTQSDEISILLTDFATRQTQAWFDGNLQKIVSIAASFATAKFNELRPAGRLAFFDARAFTIPQDLEVINYFLWRQRDAIRNSISMLAQAYFSTKQLHGKSTGVMQEMLWAEHGVNWNDEDPRFKRGTIVVPRWGTEEVRYTDKRDQQEHVGEAQRRRWVFETAPDFGASGARQWLLGDEVPDAGE
jgi:tRNA(His) 5'-end guanylyltransferase